MITKKCLAKFKMSNIAFGRSFVAMSPGRKVCPENRRPVYAIENWSNQLTTSSYQPVQPFQLPTGIKTIMITTSHDSSMLKDGMFLSFLELDISQIHKNYNASGKARAKVSLSPKRHNRRPGSTSCANRSLGSPQKRYYSLDMLSSQVTENCSQLSPPRVRRYTLLFEKTQPSTNSQIFFAQCCQPYKYEATSSVPTFQAKKEKQKRKERCLGIRQQTNLVNRYQRRTFNMIYHETTI